MKLMTKSVKKKFPEGEPLKWICPVNSVNEVVQRLVEELEDLLTSPPTNESLVPISKLERRKKKIVEPEQKSLVERFSVEFHTGLLSIWFWEPQRPARDWKKTQFAGQRRAT